MSFSYFLYLCSFPPLQNRKNLPTGTKLDTDPLTAETDGLAATKSSTFPDQMELQNLLQKLSGHSLETRQASGLGDTDSLSSQTSG